MELSKFTANCAKSAQFAHCHRKSRKIRAICVNFPRFSVPTSEIAKISGNSRFGQITQISPPIFQFGPRKMELSKFTANCTKSAQFAHCHCKSRKIHAICVNFPRFSQDFSFSFNLGTSKVESKTLLWHMTRILQP